MSIELRSIRCHYHRVTSEPCPNPAVVEVVGAAPFLLCSEHAAVEVSADPGFAHMEGWELYGAEEYARQCEAAVDVLFGVDNRNGGSAPVAENPALELALDEAITYLEEYELPRARSVLERKGGERRETAREQDFREGMERTQAALRKGTPAS